jgi:hypothetical protein
MQGGDALVGSMEAYAEADFFTPGHVELTEAIYRAVRPMPHVLV